MQKTRSDQRAKLIQQVTELAGLVIFGSLSEMYRTCGNPGCRCHGPGPKHGPHLHVVYRGESGKCYGVTRAGFDVPRVQNLETLVIMCRAGIADAHQTASAHSTSESRRPSDCQNCRPTSPRTCLQCHVAHTAFRCRQIPQVPSAPSA